MALTDEIAKADIFTDQSVIEDPYPYFDALRSRCPVHPIAQPRVLAVTGYHEALEVYRNDEVFSSFNDVEGGGKNGTGILIPQGVVRMGIIEQDPPICRDLRKLVMKWFLYG